MSTDLRKKSENYFEKEFFKLINSVVFLKTIVENVAKHRDIKLAGTEKSRNYFVSEPNCHTTKFLTKLLLAIKINKVCLGLSIPELSKTLMYEFW